MRQAPGGRRQHIWIRIQQRDLCVVWRPRMLQEVAGTGPDVQVAAAQMLPVLLHESRRGASPHKVAVEAEDHGIVDPQERAAVYFLAGVRRVRWVHCPSARAFTACASRNSETSRLNASGVSRLVR